MSLDFIQSNVALANAPPPAVGDTNLKGVSTNAAREDHTHKSSVLAKRMAVVALGTFEWVFDPPYPVGVSPICTVTVEVSDTETQAYIACLVGQPTNEKAKVMVFKGRAQTLGASLAALLNTVVNVFERAPNGVFVNCIARKPS